MTDLPKGYMIQTKDFKKIVIGEKLTEYEPRMIYKVDYDGAQKALRWYSGLNGNFLKKFYENLENIIRKGKPSNAFLWPEAVTEIQDGAFGCVRNLCPSEYIGFHIINFGGKIINGKTEKLRWPGLTAMVTAALNITAGFRAMHRKDCCFYDFNEDCILINLTDPAKYGDVLFFDDDKIFEYGKDLNIHQAARYKAPEIITGNAKPDMQTSLFSLAVALFVLFVINHPLEGKAALAQVCITAENEKKIYGENPVFILDPNDKSNEAIPEIHQGAVKRWPFLPKYLQDMFIKAFSKEVLKNPACRIREKEWIQIFVRMRGEIWKCPSCGEVYFADPVNSNPCTGCSKPYTFPFYVKTSGGYNVPVHLRTALYRCHTSTDPEDGFDIKTGEIIINNDKIELKNISNERWSHFSNGVQLPLEPGQAVGIEKGVKLDFGNGAFAEII
jgi:hypothetical protein